VSLSIDEGRGRALGEHAQQLLQLAALSFPADPALLRFGEGASAVQDDEAKRLLAAHGVERIEALDRPHGRIEQRAVAGQVLARRIAPVGEQRELHAALGIGEVVQLQLMGERGTGLRAGQHRRNHDHRPVLGADAGGERQSRQVAGSRRFADQPVDHGNRRFRGGNQHQDGGECPEPR